METKMQRFFGNFDFTVSDLQIPEREFVNQIRNVLRLRRGDKLVLCDGKRNEAVAEILELDEKSAKLKITETSKNENEPDHESFLYCAILKRENFETVLQKATEVGVSEVIPVITLRTVKLNVHYDRLEKIIREAAEQSGRGILPRLREPLKFVEAVNQASVGQNLFFDPTGPKAKSADLAFRQSVGIWIGPEGGWDATELEAVRVAGFKIMSLGKLTLRAETAAIIASYLVNHAD